MNVPLTPRRAARHVALEALSTVNRHSMSEALARPRVHFLFCHAVVPKDVAKFDHLVGTLARTHRLLGHSEAVRALHEGDIDVPTVSFSFDDGLQSNLLAAQTLERHGATGMFFVPTEFVGTPTVSEAREFFGHATEINEPAMTWSDLEMLVARGHEVGNHTARHRTLSQLSRDEATHEISQGAEMIRDRLGECRHFAWPRGAFRFFPNELRDTVFDAEHDSCSSAVRGAHIEPITDPQRLCIRRELIASYWPVRHSLYFTARSARRATKGDNLWPDAA